jgi:hypothetical protein
MVQGWIELLPFTRKKEFISADARTDFKQDSRSYEMLSKETSVEVTSQPIDASPMPALGRRTPDYFGQTARYHAPSQSFSNPRAPSQPTWDPTNTYASPGRHDGRDPLRMNNI